MLIPVALIEVLRHRLSDHRLNITLQVIIWIFVGRFAACFYNYRDITLLKNLVKITKKILSRWNLDASSAVTFRYLTPNKMSCNDGFK